AGLSSDSSSSHRPRKVFEVNAIGTLNLLEAVRRYCPQTRLFHASTAQLFEGSRATPQNEDTPFCPLSAYGVSKLAAHQQVVMYREKFGLSCTNGILFNHESPRRSGAFVTRKICDWASSYARDKDTPTLLLGNLDAVRDFGHARDFARAMWLILTPEESGRSGPPDTPLEDYVVGTGCSTSVRELVERALFSIGEKIEWRREGELQISLGGCEHLVSEEAGYDGQGRKIVSVSPAFWRPAALNEVRADASRIRRNLGWEPSVGLDELLKEMIFATPQADA
ncbi:MAG: GDP-mannose 4,6-dehydratase, partial [Planctomycetes bacterium]|nr:GDP-mannose 4,6-dehydratase [Planctomycetota bacterium]